MGGRGSSASGKSFRQTYQTVGVIAGVKVLRPLPPLHGKLPEESHRSNAYILLDDQGKFRMLRRYDNHHLLRLELAYHPERRLDPSGQDILHLHRYPSDNFGKRTPARLLAEREYRRFKRFFGEELRWTIKK